MRDWEDFVSNIYIYIYIERERERERGVKLRENPIKFQVGI